MLISIETYGIYDFPGGGEVGGGVGGGMIDPLAISKFSNPGGRVFSCDGSFSK